MDYQSERLTYPIMAYTKGATEAELLRGTKAAMQVLNAAGISAKAASDGEFARQRWDGDGFPDGGITDKQLKAAGIWDDANVAARDAISAEWSPERERPIYGVISLLTDPDVQFADRQKAVELIKQRAEDVVSGRRRWGEAGLGTLAWIIADDFVGDGREYVDPVTIAEFKLAGDLRSEQAKQELMMAIEALISVAEDAGQEFAVIRLSLPVGNAPKDGTEIVAIDAGGKVAHIRWRTGGDLDEDTDVPYWARLDDDTPFEPIAWAPSTWTSDKFLKSYG